MADLDVTRCSMQPCGAAVRSVPCGRQPVSLELEWVWAPALPQLLNALLPPVASLQRLKIATANCPAFIGCSQLRHLTALSVCVPNFRASDWQQSCNALLAQATGLSELAINGGTGFSKLAAVPASLVRYGGLTRLDLSGLGLTTLAAGNYLAGEAGEEERVPCPAQLALAEYCGLVLCQPPSCPIVRQCSSRCCRCCCSSACQTKYRLPACVCSPCCAGLESLDLCWNKLACLPDALSSATRLSRLELRGNQQLRLSLADIASLLRLPRLVRVNAAYVEHDWQEQLAQQAQPTPLLLPRLQEGQVQQQAQHAW